MFSFSLPVSLGLYELSSNNIFMHLVKHLLTTYCRTNFPMVIVHERNWFYSPCEQEYNEHIRRIGAFIRVINYFLLKKIRDTLSICIIYCSYIFIRVYVCVCVSIYIWVWVHVSSHVILYIGSGELNQILMLWINHSTNWFISLDSGTTDFTQLSTNKHFISYLACYEQCYE